MDLEKWLKEYEEKITGLFHSRILFLGLQGSCSRGEADENSDIDVVLILDQVTADDLKQYRKAIDHMDYREKICGFVAGEKEISGWDRADLFQFYYDTVPIIGSLDYFVPAPGREEAARAAVAGACGIYHSASHNFLHGQSGAVLNGLCKTAAFVMRARLFCETGTFFRTRAELYAAADKTERELLDAGQRLKSDETLLKAEFETITQTLLSWTSEMVQKYSKQVGKYI